MPQVDRTPVMRIVKRTPVVLALVLVIAASTIAAISLAGGSDRPRIGIVSTAIQCRDGAPDQVVRIKSRTGRSVEVDVAVSLRRAGVTIASASKRGRVGKSVRSFRLSLGQKGASAMPYCRLLAGSAIIGRATARRGSVRQTVRFSRTGSPQRAVTSRVVMLGSAPSPISEASGLVESRLSPGVFWTHDDSGGAASVYALDDSGDLIAEQPLSGVVNTDWEDIAIGPGQGSADDSLYIADIGDNVGVRPRVRIHRIAEPGLAELTRGGVLAAAEPQTVSLVYPDGARDAEALVVDPLSGDIFIITKRETLSRIYVARAPGFGSGGDQTLEFLGELDISGVVAADACPDGETVLVKTYFGISAFVDQDGVEQALTTQPRQQRFFAPDGSFLQDESVAADPYCTGYSTLPEGVGAPLRRFTP